jgi:[ribosomal protein S5]-alanine N-acetyltransferase
VLEMPNLVTTRLVIRPFEPGDLTAAHQLLDVEMDPAVLHSEKMDSLAARAEWLEWARRSPAQLALLNQPPYGDRAIMLRSSGELVGACGFVPCLSHFEQVPGFGERVLPPGESRVTPEFGLFWAISPAYQRQGYASEAAQALVDYAFDNLHLRRVIAETDYDNFASQGVMRKLGMRIERNAFSEPPWLQVVGVLEAQG